MTEDQAWELVKNTPAYRGVCEYLGKAETDVKLREAIFNEYYPEDIVDPLEEDNTTIGGWFVWSSTEEGHTFWFGVNEFLMYAYDDEANQNEIPV